MSEAIEKRVKILSEAGPVAPSRPGRSATSDYLKNFGGFTNFRCAGEDSTLQPCNIIFPQSAYEIVMQHLAEDVSREHGGFLLGHELYTSDTEAPTVVIDYAIPAKHTQGTPVRLTFTEDTWRALDEVTDKLRETGREIQRVGWYHSHPDLAIFLSHYDLDVCTIFDCGRCPVALVVDPVKTRAGFFVRGKNGYAPHSAQGFLEAHDLRPESIVKWTNMTRTTPAPGKTNESVIAGGNTRGTTLRIESRPSRRQRLAASAFRIAAAVLFCVMLGALYALFDKQERLERQVDDLSAALAKKPPSIPSSSTPGTSGGDTRTDVDKTATADTTRAASASTKSSGSRSSIPKKSQTPAVNTATMSIDPQEADLEPGKTRSFTVEGAGEQIPLWSVTPHGVGTFKLNEASMEYTAPANTPVKKLIVSATVGKKALHPAVIHLVPRAHDNATSKSSTLPTDQLGGNGGNTVTGGSTKSSHDNGGSQGTSGQSSSGQGTSGQSQSGQSTSDQKAAGQNTADQKATGQNTSAQTTSQGTSGQTTSGQGTSGQITDKEAQANQGTTPAPPQTGTNPKAGSQHGSGSETSRPEPSPSPAQPPKP